MREQRILSLLIIFALACIFIQSAVRDCLGICDYQGSNSWEYSPIQSESEQAAWRAEIYSFMNCDNCDNLSNSRAQCGANSTGANAVALAFDQTGYANNNTANYWLENANKLYLAGHYEQAAASYARALELNSLLTEGRINMANSLYFLGKYKESLDAFNAVIASDPLNANAILGKDKVMMAINRTREGNASI